MKLRTFVLAVLIAACTRSQSTTPLGAEPPVTLIANPTPPAPPSVEAAPTSTGGTSTGGFETRPDRPDTPVPAASGPWSLWRRGVDGGQLFRADASGQVVEIRLPALDGTTPSPEFALAPDGRSVFYTLLASSGGVVAQHLALYDLTTDELQTAALEEYNLVDYGAVRAAFSPDGAQIALTLEGFPQNDNTQPSFRVFLWDLGSNEVTTALTPDTPIGEELLPPTYLPLVARWYSDGVLLVGHLYQTATYAKAMLWEPATEKVSAAPDPSPGFAFGGARLPGSNEVAWPDYGEGYPTQPLECWGADQPDNVVKWLDLTEGTPRVIFGAGASEQVGKTLWLNGGERLALVMIGCDKQATRVVTLERDGAATDAISLSGDPAVFAWGNELIALTEDLEADTTTIVAYDGAQNWAAREIASFRGTLGAAGYAFYFVAQAQAAQTRLEPFPEVGAETSRSGLQIGKKATVASSSGVLLNIRTEPNQEAPALGLLATGTEVTILDGPATAPNGIVYWKVEAPNGLVGWCAEAVEGEQTLIPKP